MPKRFSFVSTDCPTAIITCFKPEEDGYVLRLYEAGGVSYEQVNVKVNIDVVQAAEVDFTEKLVESGSAVLSDGMLTFALGAHEVKTFRFITPNRFIRREKNYF